MDDIYYYMDDIYYSIIRHYMDDMYYSIMRLLNNTFTLYRYYVEYDAEYVPLSASLAQIRV
jgi:hypothetical protein